MTTSRLDKLVIEIRSMYEANWVDIDNLPTLTERGGRNARNISGWSHSPNGTVTKAARIAGCPVLPYWSGSAPTPASAIPSCIWREAIEACQKIYNK